MDITIKITTDNDAFAHDPAAEVSRILADFVNGIFPGDAIEDMPCKLMDVNGNTCGSVKVSK